ncbi:MAG TPA: GNAT family N-acetyltransferase [Candidatus Acidoferrales bacterium]|nr:GNAT family N-acetyltransferase [Candidatus Acidoferrales bacterium]
MSKWTRKKIRQAVNRGIRIREGGRDDVTTFFELMLSTCRRQRTAPVPADKRTMLALWDAAQAARCIRLTFAEQEGKPVAGLLSILFGQTASFWKKGWTSLDGHLHPNELLMQEMLEWSSARGYRFADFCAVDRGMAVAMLSGEPLSSEQEGSRHMFNIRFGGRPRLLPEARVYFPNPGIRLAYRAIYRKKIRQAGENYQLGRRAAEDHIRRPKSGTKHL